MSQVINTNALSLVAQNNLNKSQSTLGTAIQRLSSGLRINSAKDDAAGQAISNRFTASISGLTQASRNANDGISIAQTTEGALNEVNDNLQNIRRLTVQAQNGTNSDSDRSSIQDEIDARLEEINRIADQTEFNGVKVLSRDQALSIQVGSDDAQTIDIELNKVSDDSLGLTDFAVEDRLNNIPLTTVQAGTSIQVEQTYELNNLEKTGGTANATDIVKEAGNDQLYAKCDDGNYYPLWDFGNGCLRYDSGYPKATLANPTTSVKGEKYMANNVEVNDASLAGFGGNALKTDNKGNFFMDDGAGSLTKVDVKLTHTGYGLDMIPTFTDTRVACGGKVSTAEPLKKIDAALAKVDKLRSGLGAVQNRFDSVISNLNNTVNNLSESRSRILDADFASEVSEMSRANILQSAGTSVLAQANQVPQNVLQLLR
ncbi:FliC/FljB family flagellin [Escherichia ruysiae]|uniref:FliC/FljB family flagellin n=1 Tax=Escherichia ruysiae TaxID=2608867 RepID=UPI001C9A6C59|nr:FliC/FljB family flagellin [Escherichia ruysiae]MBY7351608.1 FliC/FljB family flagellin [Escherichia ruysiae]